MLFNFKVIPPPEWVPRKNGYDSAEISNIVIPAPIRQVKNQNKQISPHCIYNNNNKLY